ncbi:beta-ketoacyl-[acyl-carrier-protein] synthase II [Clostridium diolis]|nr:beta-ketoacyl-[acyl-carrier-protein] synthase II [Clostridium diolis]
MNIIMSKRRVVITGMGVISPSGNDLDSFWTSLIKGESNTGSITKFDVTNSDVKIAGEVKNFNIKDYGFPFMLTRKLDVFTHYAMAATKMAISDSAIGLESVDRNRFGVFVGNCLGGVGFGERELFNLYQKGYDSVSPYQSISWFYTAPQGQISIFYKLKGYSKTFVTDRISSDIAIGNAYQSIQLNRIDASFVCGTEAGLFPYGLTLFSSSGVLSKRNDCPSKVYRPYDLNRDGMVLGEGSGVLLIEELEHALKRNAKIYGEILSFDSNCDGVHHKNNDYSGKRYKDVIESCISKAQITPNEIDYINLDGSGLWKDDIIETNVLKDVFGTGINDISLSCPKSMFGNTFGAAGAIDAIINCLIIKNNKIPPTINYENEDKQCDLNYTPNKAVDREVNTVLQIARGRGGVNSAMIIREFKG